jgi:hypothetical protein
MRLRGAVVTLAVIAASGFAPGAGHAASSEPEPQVVDECGDAATRASVGGVSQRVEDNRPELDISTGRISLDHVDGAVESLDIVLTMCGNASRDVNYTFGWSFGDACFADVEFLPRDLDEAILEPQVRFRERCSENSAPLPVLGVSLGNDVREVSHVVLPASAATFEGRQITLSVPVAVVPAASQPRFAVGTQWTGTAVIARDPDAGTFTFAAGTDTPPVFAAYRLDLAAGDGYMVGQDAPSSAQG